MIAQDVLGGRAAVLLTLIDGPARATTLHDRIRERTAGRIVVTDGACRKALACLARDGLVEPLMICGKDVGRQLTARGFVEARALRSACLALASIMPAVKLVSSPASMTA